MRIFALLFLGVTRGVSASGRLLGRNSVRTVVASTLIIFLLFTNSHAETVRPGMALEDATKVLSQHGFDVDTIKYGLNVAPDDARIGMEFCRIDDNITLVLSYSRRTKAVTQLDCFFVSGNHSADRYLVREVLQMTVDKDTYTLKLKRQPQSEGKSDTDPAANN